MRVIKRYRNYKFYDTVDKLYVSLQEIASTYLEGDCIKFIIHDTQVDITDKTITKLKRIQHESKNNDIHSQR